MSTELKGLIDDLHKAHTDLRKNNEGEITSFKEEVNKKLNAFIDCLEEKVAAIETANARSASANASNEEKFEKAAKHFKSFATAGHNAELKAFSVGSANDGGDTVPEIIDSTIARIVTEKSVLRPHANVVTISNDEWRKLVSQGGATTGWVSETGSRSATNTPQTRPVTGKAHELYAYPSATLQSLEDSQFDLQAFLTDEVADGYAIAEGNAFFNGTGASNNQPSGMLNESVYTRGTNGAWGQVQEYSAGTSLNADDIIALTESIKSEYQGSAKFFMPRSVRQIVRTLKDAYGQYLLQPSLALGKPATLCGYDVVEIPSMAGLTGSPSTGDAMIFGDMKKFYTIIDRKGLSVTTDVITSPGTVKFYFRKRVGGVVVDTNAAKVLAVS